MNVVVNGTPRTVPRGASVADLLREIGLREGVAAAVELNGAVVPRAEHGARRLSEGDRVEVVTLVGGG